VASGHRTRCAGRTHVRSARCGWRTQLFTAEDDAGHTEEREEASDRIEASAPGPRARSVPADRAELPLQDGEDKLSAWRSRVRAAPSRQAADARAPGQDNCALPEAPRVRLGCVWFMFYGPTRPVGCMFGHPHAPGARPRRCFSTPTGCIRRNARSFRFLGARLWSSKSGRWRGEKFARRVQAGDEEVCAGKLGLPHSISRHPPSLYPHLLASFTRALRPHCLLGFLLPGRRDLLVAVSGVLIRPRSSSFLSFVSICSRIHRLLTLGFFLSYSPTAGFLLSDPVSFLSFFVR
jgi:hypothetical protein